MDKVYIIAEAGVNHNGSLELAKKLVDIAVEAGADAVKFQTFKAENLVTAKAKQAKYQIDNIKSETSQYEMLKKLELQDNDFFYLAEYCNSKGIDFLSSPFDIESINLLNQIGMKYFKIPSGEIQNIPYLRKVAQCNKPIILSTGMSNMDEIKHTYNLLKTSGAVDVIVLHCNTDYPTKMKDVNLKAMVSLRNELNCEVGYSDHTLGVEVAIAAVAMGAKFIEKHFTIDKKMEGPDHIASLAPDELMDMVKKIRNIEVALGTGVKIPSESEMRNKNVARKSIVANKKIPIGEILTEDNVTIKRPAGGLEPYKWDFIIGKKATKNYEKDDFIYE